MSLTVTLTHLGKLRGYYDESKSFTLDSGDGFWNYLQPWLFDLNERCAETLELYEIYFLKPTTLPVLVEVLTSALAQARQSPESIRIVTGARIDQGETTEICATIGRSELIGLIEKMISITTEAIRSGETLVNLGD